MTEKRLLALLGFLLGLVAFAFILIGVLQIGRGETIDFALVVSRFVDVILAIAILLGSLMIYRGSHQGGGIVNLVMGIVVIVWPGGSLTAGVLAIVSGVLGLVAGETRR